MIKRKKQSIRKEKEMEDQNKESNIQQEMPEKIGLTTFLKKYNSFKGRSSRKEFWFAILFCLILKIVCLITIIACIQLFSAPILVWWTLFVWGLFLLLVLILAYFSLCVRRLHDLGIGGIWVFLLFLIAPGAFGPIGYPVVAGLLYIMASILDALALIFLISTFVLLAVLAFVPSQKKTNKYGEYPYETNGAELTNTEDNKDAEEQSDNQKSDPEKAQSND